MDRRDFVRLGAVAGAMAVRGKPLAAETRRPSRKTADAARCRPPFFRCPVRARGGDALRPSGGDGGGTDDRAIHHAAVSGSHRGSESEWSSAAPRARDQSRRALDRRFAGSGAEGGQSARAPARHSDSAQGQHRYRRPDDHDGRLIGARGIHSAPGRVHRRRSSARPARFSSARRISANGRTSGRRTRRAVGADAAGRRRIRTCSTEIHADPARDLVEQSRQTYRRSQLGPRPMDRSFARRPQTE